MPRPRSTGTATLTVTCVSVGLLADTVSSAPPYAFCRWLPTAAALYDCVGLIVPFQCFAPGKTRGALSLALSGAELAGGALAQPASAVETTAAVSN
jgi:hypothetical protein